MSAAEDALVSPLIKSAARCPLLRPRSRSRLPCCSRRRCHRSCCRIRRAVLAPRREWRGPGDGTSGREPLCTTLSPRRVGLLPARAAFCSRREWLQVCTASGREQV